MTIRFSNITTKRVQFPVKIDGGRYIYLRETILILFLVSYIFITEIKVVIVA